MTTHDAGALNTEILDLARTRAGDANRRAFVGPPHQYDFMGATQFRLLTALGLRETHSVVDIGCGSLRAGRYLIAYLLPGHYTGIEPNTWLWQEAVDKELGRDFIEINRPRLLDEADFRMTGVGDESADFIVAQSIYSHTGSDLFEASLAAAARCLAPQGQFLLTIIRDGDAGAQTMPRLAETQGWVYPDCVGCDPADLQARCAALGLEIQELPWFHPRQTWYRAVKDPALVMTPEMFAQVGTGKPLFDPRFRSA